MLLLISLNCNKVFYTKLAYKYNESFFIFAIDYK